MNGTALLNFLQGIAQTRLGLSSCLAADPARAFVYYLCPLANLRRIVVNGILPHASAPADRTDLSGQSVQARRDVELPLSNDTYDYRNKTLHHSVNFFFNPLNLTFRAFQRHGVLREAVSKNPDDGVVCILELGLDQFIQSVDCFWTLSPSNIAGSPFANFTPPFFTGERRREDGTPYFDWTGIYSVGEPQYDREINKKRSAEFVAHIEANPMETTSKPIPLAWIHRIIVPAQEVRQINEEQLAFLASTGKEISRLDVHEGVALFVSRDELLKPEAGFVKNLRNRQKGDAQIVDRLNRALNVVTQFEEQHPELSPTADIFKHPSVSDGLHGTLHTVRVMIWAAFLAQHLDEAERDRILPIVLAAASVHDTYRESNHEDQIHGALAAEGHGERLRNAVGDQEVNSCLEAVRLHCLPVANCNNRDLVWQILKDADGLDRGRFNWPNDPEKGCNPNFFRTEALRAGAPYHNISWMAFYLAQMTRYTPTDNTPCANVCSAIYDGVAAYLN
jgi:hypothetical protein